MSVEQQIFQHDTGNCTSVYFIHNQWWLRQL